MDTTAAPSGRVPGLRSREYNSSAPSSPMALVASSRKRTDGRRSTACATASRCCSPPERMISQFASSAKPRSPSALSRATALNAIFTCSSVKWSSLSGYAKACFSVPCGMCDRCGTKSTLPRMWTTPVESGQIPASARKKQLFPEPSGAVRRTNSPCRTVRPAFFQISLAPPLAGSVTQMPSATRAASGEEGAAVLHCRTCDPPLCCSMAMRKLCNRSAVARKSVRTE
mmetsp:Transcript_68869/g.190640  ORF Transcript_68869/g.190640 Transcript_68869/m.190640 type:complete len:228 (-) Transcript_68869:926-1609(-)